MSNYFDGAVMAYRDAAEFIKNTADKVPEAQSPFAKEYSKYVKEIFYILHSGLIDKSNLILSEQGKPIIPRKPQVAVAVIMPGQKRKHSFLESVLNLLIGAALSLTLQLLVFPLFGWNPPLHDNLMILGIFTISSVIRSYGLRRLFNFLHLKGILK
jgi:hypothetical protein